VKNIIRISAAALFVAAPGLAMAATQTGNLNVSTTINVSCSSPSPSGTLNLPFDSARALDDQAPANTKVDVTVTCFGNPTVNHVDFGDGSNRGTNRDEPGVRYMARGDADTPKHFLGYKLYATTNLELNSATIVDAGTEILHEGSSGNGNRLTIGSTSGSFAVSGKIFESVERTGAFGDPTDAISGAEVPGGTYNDVVVMTIDFN